MGPTVAVITIIALHNSVPRIVVPVVGVIVAGVDIGVVGVDEWPPLNGESKHSRLQKIPELVSRRIAKTRNSGKERKKAFLRKKVFYRFSATTTRSLKKLGFMII